MSVFGTGADASTNEDFLGGLGSAKFPRAIALEFSPSSALGTDLPIPVIAYKGKHTMSNGHASPTFPRPPFNQQNISGVGILTYCPSPSLVRYGLGPPYPTPINVA